MASQGSDLPASPSSLLLAAHHDRYALLLRVFLAWKERVQMRRGRRNRWSLGVMQRYDSDERNVAVIVRIRSAHAIRRWRRFVRLKKGRDVLLQRAYFFLYYCLLKWSLNQLGRHALIKKREHAMVITIVKVNRQRLLIKTMQLWRLRLRLHQTLTIWRSYVRQRQHRSLLYRPIVNAVTQKTHRRLLQLAFNAWEKEHTRHRAQHMLIRVVDRHVYKSVCERAWSKWKTQVRQLVQLDAFERGFQERRLRRVWTAWSVWTRKKEHREQQRRRAVRVYYLSLLRKGFSGLQTWRTHQQVTLNRVETMLDAADVRIISSVFSRWNHLVSERKLKALKSVHAFVHYKSRLLRRVWLKGFRFYISEALTKKKLTLLAKEHHHKHIIRQSFLLWKDAWQAECDREESLDKMLLSFVVKKGLSVKACVLENWFEYARAKAARRAVSSQVRGQAQQRTVQRHLSRWATYVSVLRWEKITCTRADQHYKKVMWRKCFERWRYNAIRRQHYRKKTCAALIHWKLTLERRTFDGWKQYLHAKRMKQLRIHEALEFRHEQFVRDGLRRWMTAALHLQEQREQQVTRTQASYTTNIWRKVAAIARHWRYLVIRRRAINGEQQNLKQPRDVPRRMPDDVYWQSKYRYQENTQHATLPQPPAVNFRQTNVLLDDENGSNWTKQGSPLSEFVLLPRNRPQPRRPVEVLLFSQEAETFPVLNEHSSAHEALRCGFDFPAEPFAPLCPPQDTKANPPNSHWKPPPSITMNLRERRKCPVLSTTTSVTPRKGNDLLLPNATARQLDALERQLLALSHRKREWKASQRQIEALRDDADANPRLLSKLRAMEEQHAAHTKQWFQMKGRIRSLATEIQNLRSALQR
ncbi:hypothetical protein PHPALM_31982 [Phytophthora palmivora]|uniref:Sfi1 spindle body domain-containing protein n=1 Tax=Phytophthora palmivora TaxID=4796 RepID=A0A2P4X182_9STRA|nr:hypothetical protein PHPALM_31982 [Phytophthora palmivora]